MKAPVFLATIAATCLSTYTLAQQTVGTFQANDFIQLFETMTGPQPGHRKAHARGLCATGRFAPAISEAFAGSPLLSSGELPVQVRFSIGGGNPQADERIPGARGMGAQASPYKSRLGNSMTVM